MKMILKSSVVVLGMAAGLSWVGSAAAAERVIGTTTYEAQPLRDTLNIGGKEGQFKAIRMEAKQSDIEVLDLKVVYSNGSSEDIRVRQTFKAGTSSRTIDLKGYTRGIKQIIVTYVPKGPAKLVFYGVEGAAVFPSWENLGCKQVNFLVDKDTIEVGRKEGTYKSLRLKVRQAPVELFDIRVTFGNGDKQTIQVRQAVPAGAESRPIDLNGKSRGIQRIEMLYRSIPSFKGKAEICVDGKQS
jgi:hypothetical protein